MTVIRSLWTLPLLIGLTLVCSRMTMHIYSQSSRRTLAHIGAPVYNTSDVILIHGGGWSGLYLVAVIVEVSFTLLFELVEFPLHNLLSIGAQPKIKVFVLKFTVFHSLWIFLLAGQFVWSSIYGFYQKHLISGYTVIIIKINKYIRQHRIRYSDLKIK